MSRYIDDKWLEDNAKEYSLGYYEEDEWAIPLSLLEEAPSIDIVRCKECKHGEYREDFDDYLCDQLGLGLVNDADFFCSYGEKE